VFLYSWTFNFKEVKLFTVSQGHSNYHGYCAQLRPKELLLPLAPMYDCGAGSALALSALVLWTLPWARWNIAPFGGGSYLLARWNIAPFGRDAYNCDTGEVEYRIQAGPALHGLFI
jgi:hypothetical protein